MNAKNLESKSEDLFLHIEALEEKILIYQARLKKNKIIYQYAVETSTDELKDDFKKILQAMDDPKIDIPMEVLVFGKDILGSSIWIIRAYLRYVKSFLQFSTPHKSITGHEHEYILKLIQEDKSLDEAELSYGEVFQCIFNELCLDYENFNYQTTLKTPKINATIVLVSGVLNELYKTAAFERGAQHLKSKYGIKYLNAEVHGRKGSTHNARIIEDQLIKYIQKNPDEKLWILAYSKGGIDSLHLLKRNPEFANKYILGLSTIASPIKGSPHADSRLIKLLKTMHRLEHSKIYRKIDGGRNLLLKNVPRFLSEGFQTRWFERNKKYLPENIFYTSLALESEWYKAHIWMLLAKLVFRSDSPNDGVVDIERAHFPEDFPHYNFGVTKGHHLISTRSSTFNQEALIEAHIITLHYLGLLH